MNDFSPINRRRAASPQNLRTFTVGDDEGQPTNNAYDSMDSAANLINRVNSQKTVSRPNISQEAEAQAAKELKEFEDRVNQARKDKIDGVSRLSPLNKDRLNHLLNAGRTTKDVPIDDAIYTLRTLKGKELRKLILDNINKTDITQEQFKLDIRQEQLARAIYKIDGELFENVIANDDFVAKMEYVEELDEYVIAKLSAENDLLNAEAKKKFGLDTPEVEKEVVEDLKKA